MNLGSHLSQTADFNRRYIRKIWYVFSNVSSQCSMSASPCRTCEVCFANFFDHLYTVESALTRTSWIFDTFFLVDLRVRPEWYRSTDVFTTHLGNLILLKSVSTHCLPHPGHKNFALHLWFLTFSYHSLPWQSHKLDNTCYHQFHVCPSFAL